MPVARIALVGCLMLVGAASVPSRAQSVPELTIARAQEQLRAMPDLPVPPDLLRVTDLIEFEGDQAATVDFAGREVHVRFRKTGAAWAPSQIPSRSGGWVPIAAGFAQMTEMDQSGAISTLRGLVSGQATYAAVCGQGFYAPTLTALAAPEPGQRQGFILESDVPARGTTVLEKYRYRIEMTAPPSPKSPRSCNGVPAGGSAQTWSATARRTRGFAGKSYRINVEGELSEIK